MSRSGVISAKQLEALTRMVESNKPLIKTVQHGPNGAGREVNDVDGLPVHPSVKHALIQKDLIWCTEKGMIEKQYRPTRSGLVAVAGVGA